MQVCTSTIVLVDKRLDLMSRRTAASILPNLSRSFFTMTFCCTMSCLQAFHANMKTKPAPPILCSILATLLQVLVPAYWFSIFCLCVKSLEFGRHLAQGFGCLVASPLVAIAFWACAVWWCRCIDIPLLDPLHWRQVNIDPWIIHQTSDLFIKWWVGIHGCRFQSPCVLCS